MYTVPQDSTTKLHFQLNNSLYLQFNALESFLALSGYNLALGHRFLIIANLVFLISLCLSDYNFMSSFIPRDCASLAITEMENRKRLQKKGQRNKVFMSPRDGYRSRSLKYCNPVPAKSKCKYTEEMSALINPAGKTHIIEVVLYHLVPSQCITATYRYPGNPHSS